MRFCPFCSAENQDAATECAACNRRLPPLPPRRRKNGLERTAPIAKTTPEDVEVAAQERIAASEPELLGTKPKTLADLAASPAAERRPVPPSEPAPAGTNDRRRPTATPVPRGRGRTMPPIPSRTERDRIASLSTGVAPGLASESVPLPQNSSQASPSEVLASPPPTPPPVASAPVASPSVASAPVASPPPTPGPVASPPVASPPPTPVPVTPVKAKPNSVDTKNNSDDGWPAPSRMPASHPDDWNLDPAAQSVAPTELAVPVAAEPPKVPAPADLVSGANDGSSASETTAVSAPKQAHAQASAVPSARPVVVSEPFKAADVAPVPSVPEAGLMSAVKYTVSFARARWQRRGAIGDLRDQISKDTGILDGILGTLGRQTRSMGLESKALETENSAIDGAEDRRKTAEHACSELSNRQAEENSKFADSESDRLAKVADADRALDIAQTELGAMEAQRRDLRDQRKTIENRQKGYLKAADSRDADSEKQEDREKREELRGAAKTLRRDAEQLSDERQDIDRRYDALEEPVGQLSSRVDALKSDRDAAKRSLTDLREGHRHRLAEIDAEQGRKSRELAQAEAEIERRYVTLGTLVNLNRIDRSEFVGIYEQIDTLRGAIGARSNEIDKLSAERQAFDKASLIRGACVLGGAFLLFLALLAILLTAT